MYPSQGPYNQRAFESFWKPFVRVFQLLGISHYSLFHTTDRIGRMIYYITFSTLHIVLMFYTFWSGLHINMIPTKKYKTSPLMFYVNLASVSGTLVAHIVAHLEPLFARKHEHDIYRKLNEINEIFATKLNYVTDFKIIRKRFIWHIVMFYTFSTTISIVYSLYSMPTNAFDIILFLGNRVLSAIVNRARRCQLMFLIDSMGNILLDLQILLKRQQKSYRPNSGASIENSSENIRYLRDIYSSVWLLRNKISCCYGWSFIAILMEFAFDLINSSYWAYMNIKIYENTNMIIRKFFFVEGLNLNFIYFNYKEINNCYKLITYTSFNCSRNHLLHHINYHEFLVYLHGM